jgi:ADP-glucose pyrophosphorylase
VKVLIEPGVELEDCFIMDYVRVKRGARMRRVIVDRHNMNESNSVTGIDPQAELACYDVTPGGVVVVPWEGRIISRAIHEAAAWVMMNRTAPEQPG